MDDYFDAAWHPDPSGRHELRLWQEGSWTDYVMDNKVPGTDPYDGSQLPPAPVLPSGPGLGGTDSVGPGTNRVPSGFVDAVKICFAKYANFRGRAARSEFWWFLLFSVLGPLGITVVTAAVGVHWEVHRVLLVLWYLAIAVPFFAVAVRRLHDTGRSGLWVLLAFIPYVGFALVVLLAMPTRATNNIHGTPPSLVDPP